MPYNQNGFFFFFFFFCVGEGGRQLILELRLIREAVADEVVYDL